MPPRFHPRDFMIDPAEFGEDPDALWKAGTSFTETCQIAAAYAQHLAASSQRCSAGSWTSTRSGSPWRATAPRGRPTARESRPASATTETVEQPKTFVPWTTQARDFGTTRPHPRASRPSQGFDSATMSGSRRDPSAQNADSLVDSGVFLAQVRSVVSLA